MAMTATTRCSGGRQVARAIACLLATVAAALGVAACSGPSVPVPGPAPSAAAPVQHGGGKGIRGQVSAENGTTWTVIGTAGEQYTVTITSQTQFGSKKQPGTAAQFPVGCQIRVTGTVDGTQVSATRIEGTKSSEPADPAPNETS